MEFMRKISGYNFVDYKINTSIKWIKNYLVIKIIERVYKPNWTEHRENKCTYE